MKFIIVVAVVMVVLFIIRSNQRERRAAPPPAAAPKRPPGPPQEMVQCAVCAVHLPRGDALPGPGGRVFCCAEHRASAGA